MFSSHSNNALVPDGHLVIQAVKEFFLIGELLKEFNAIIITLIPQILNPSKMEDFRPIYYSNTIQKSISKIISKGCNRFCSYWLTTPNRRLLRVGK